jgi:hypothetical protein
MSYAEYVSSKRRAAAVVTPAPVLMAVRKGKQDVSGAYVIPSARPKSFEEEFPSLGGKTAVKTTMAISEPKKTMSALIKETVAADEATQKRLQAESEAAKTNVAFVTLPLKGRSFIDATSRAPAPKSADTTTDIMSRIPSLSTYLRNCRIREEEAARRRRRCFTPPESEDEVLEEEPEPMFDDVEDTGEEETEAYDADEFDRHR